MYKNNEDKKKYNKQYYLEHRNKCSCGKLISGHSVLCHSCAEQKYWNEHPELRKKDKFCKICGNKIAKRSTTLLCRIHAIEQCYREGKLNQNGYNNSFYGKTHTEEYKKILGTRFKKEGNSNWQGGISFLPYSPEFTNELKEQIRKDNDYKCLLCNKSQEQELVNMNRRLAIHHVDYNKDNCDKENLVSLCCKCNSKVNSNRSYWQEIFTKKLERVIK